MEVPTYIFVEVDDGKKKKKKVEKINSCGFQIVNWLLTLFEKSIKYLLTI